jgi:hypothetical protein
MTAVYVHRDERPARWCAVRVAHPGGRIWLACGDSISYGPVLIATDAPGELGCAACRAAMGAGPATPRDLGPDEQTEASWRAVWCSGEHSISSESRVPQHAARVLAPSLDDERKST